MKKLLLLCGVASSLLYVVMNIAAAALDKDYSSFSQTVSELSAIDAPTRTFWVPFGIIYSLLVGAFGYGVYISGSKSRPLRVVGILLLVYGIIGPFWPPMHQREVLAAGGGTLTDTMHIVFTIVTVVLMTLAIGFSAAAFGKVFRYYSIATIFVLFIFGGLTGMQASNLEANLPTPWAGVWERINIAAFLLWIIVLATSLLRPHHEAETSSTKSDATFLFRFFRY
jgi:hypothetical protein